MGECYSYFQPQAIREDFWCKIAGRELILFQADQEKARFSSVYLTNFFKEGECSLIVVTIGGKLE